MKVQIERVGKVIHKVVSQGKKIRADHVPAICTATRAISTDFPAGIRFICDLIIV